MTVVDTHHHYWRVDPRPQTPPHDRDYEPEHLRGELRAAGVTATVLVESVDEAAENDRMRAYQSATPTVAGVVAWLPLRDPGAARRELDRIDGMPRLSGVRCLVGREPLDWLAGPDVRALFGELADRGLAWDVVAVTPGQVEAVCELAAAVPRLRIVVDHLARPPLDGGPWEPWADAVRALAACSNVALKLSVGLDALTAWERWDASALTGCVAHAVEQFTPDRLMLASNWPVVLLRCSYAQAWRDMSAAVAACGVTGAGREAVMGATAVRWYGLAVPAP